MQTQVLLSDRHIGVTEMGPDALYWPVQPLKQRAADDTGQGRSKAAIAEVSMVLKFLTDTMLGRKYLCISQSVDLECACAEGNRG